MNFCKEYKDKHSLINTVAYNGQKLFTMCHVESKTYTMSKSFIGSRILDKLFCDKDFYGFLQYLNQQIVVATKNLERQNSHIQAVETEKKTLEIKLQVCLAEKEALQQQMMALTAQMPPSVKTALPSKDDLGVQKEWIEHIISIRDTLEFKLEWLQDNQPEEMVSKKLILSLLEQTAVLLQNHNVTILAETGALDKSKHVVQDVEYTTDVTLDNQIAKIFRAGYQYENICIRGQEVIVYVVKPE